MHLAVHPLQIGTLAFWLTAAGAGLFGLILDVHQAPPPPPVHGPMLVAAQLGTPEAAGDRATETTGEALGPLPQPAEPLFEAPPALAPFDDLAQVLPELPPLPAPEAGPTVLPKAVPGASPNATGGSSTSATRSTASITKSSHVQPSTRPGGQSGGAAGSKGLPLAARLAAGSMPADYPPEARRRGQQGTVVVGFTITESGRVAEATILKTSPWPALNAAALRAVSGWKFPPGESVRIQRPIIYQLR